MRLTSSGLLLIIFATVTGLPLEAEEPRLPIKKDGILLPSKQKAGPLTIEWIKVPDFGWSPFIIVKFSRSIVPGTLDLYCGNHRFGAFNNTNSLLEALQNANNEGTPVEIELAPQPCITIEDTNFLAVKYIKFFGKKYSPKGSVGNAKPLKKGSRKKIQINPSW